MLRCFSFARAAPRKFTSATSSPPAHVVAAVSGVRVVVAKSHGKVYQQQSSSAEAGRLQYSSAGTSSTDTSQEPARTALMKVASLDSPSLILWARGCPLEGFSQLLQGAQLARVAPGGHFVRTVLLPVFRERFVYVLSSSSSSASKSSASSSSGSTATQGRHLRPTEIEREAVLLRRLLELGVFDSTMRTTSSAAPALSPSSQYEVLRSMSRRICQCLTQVGSRMHETQAQSQQHSRPHHHDQDGRRNNAAEEFAVPFCICVKTINHVLPAIAEAVARADTKKEDASDDRRCELLAAAMGILSHSSDGLEHLIAASAHPPSTLVTSLSTSASSSSSSSAAAAATPSTVLLPTQELFHFVRIFRSAVTLLCRVVVDRDSAGQMTSQRFLDPSTSFSSSASASAARMMTMTTTTTTSDLGKCELFCRQLMQLLEMNVSRLRGSHHVTILQCCAKLSSVLIQRPLLFPCAGKTGTTLSTAAGSLSSRVASLSFQTMKQFSAANGPGASAFPDEERGAQGSIDTTSALPRGKKHTVRSTANPHATLSAQKYDTTPAALVRAVLSLQNLLEFVSIVDNHSGNSHRSSFQQPPIDDAKAHDDVARREPPLPSSSSSSLPPPEGGATGRADDSLTPNAVRCTLAASISVLASDLKAAKPWSLSIATWCELLVALRMILKSTRRSGGATSSSLASPETRSINQSVSILLESVSANLLEIVGRAFRQDFTTAHVIFRSLVECHADISPDSLTDACRLLITKVVDLENSAAYVGRKSDGYSSQRQQNGLSSLVAIFQCVARLSVRCTLKLHSQEHRDKQQQNCHQRGSSSSSSSLTPGSGQNENVKDGEADHTHSKRKGMETSADSMSSSDTSIASLRTQLTRAGAALYSYQLKLLRDGGDAASSSSSSDSSSSPLTSSSPDQSQEHEDVSGEGIRRRNRMELMSILSSCSESVRHLFAFGATLHECNSVVETAVLCLATLSSRVPLSSSSSSSSSSPSSSSLSLRSLPGSVLDNGIKFERDRMFRLLRLIHEICHCRVIPPPPSAVSLDDDDDAGEKSPPPPQAPHQLEELLVERCEVALCLIEMEFPTLFVEQQNKVENGDGGGGGGGGDRSKFDHAPVELSLPALWSTVGECFVRCGIDAQPVLARCIFHAARQLFASLIATNQVDVVCDVIASESSPPSTSDDGAVSHHHHHQHQQHHDISFAISVLLSGNTLVGISALFSEIQELTVQNLHGNKPGNIRRSVGEHGGSSGHFEDIDGGSSIDDGDSGGSQTAGETSHALNRTDAEQFIYLVVCAEHVLYEFEEEQQEEQTPKAPAAASSSSSLMEWVADEICKEFALDPSHGGAIARALRTVFDESMSLSLPVDLHNNVAAQLPFALSSRLLRTGKKDERSYFRRTVTRHVLSTLGLRS